MVFIKAEGMKRVKTFPSFKVALIYVALNHHRWKARTLLAGSGFPVTKRGYKNPNYYDKMRLFTVDGLLDDLFNCALIEARNARTRT